MDFFLLHLILMTRIQENSTTSSYVYTPSVIFKEDDPHRRRVPLLARSTRCNCPPSFLPHISGQERIYTETKQIASALNHQEASHNILEILVRYF